VSESSAPRPAAGFIEPQVRDEFPGLRLDWIILEAWPRPSPPWLIRRLQDLSSRYLGGGVVAMRTKPIPQAYRAFFRQIGLDPDVWRIPSEHAAVNRLLHGEFRSAGLIADVCLVALVETGVPVWALDADTVDEAGLGIRTTTVADAERAAEQGGYLAPGTLAVADPRSIHGLLFGEPAPGHGVGSGTRRVALFAIGVDGVPAIHIEEALWICVDLLG
jgi:DNA/RNA-binding domain of Phe-tRNA-synthetase-like protein